MKTDILKYLNADLADFEAQVRADLKARLAANADASKVVDAIGLEPYVVDPASNFTNLLGELAEKGAVFRVNGYLGAAQMIGSIGSYANPNGKIIPMGMACASIVRLESGDQTVVFPTPDAIHWIPRSGVYRLEVAKLTVAGKPDDALLVQEFGLPVQGQGPSSWLLDYLSLPKDLASRLQRVLTAMRPDHQAVAMAAICHPGIAGAHAAGLSTYALEVGVKAAMWLETVNMERNCVSLARLACLISELGSLEMTHQSRSEPSVNTSGGRVVQADKAHPNSTNSSKSSEAGSCTSVETQAHPRTVQLLADLLGRFSQIDPQSGTWLRDLLGVAVHQHFRLGSRSGPFAVSPVNPTFAAMAEPLVCALRSARQSLQITENAHQPLFVVNVAPMAVDTPANDSPAQASASASGIFATSGVADADPSYRMDSDSDLAGLAALLSEVSEAPVLDRLGDRTSGSTADYLCESRQLGADRRAYVERSVAGPRPSLDWAAGMLDGDGCIAIIKQTFPNRNPIYRLVVQVCQNCLQTLQHFRECVGVYSPINEVKRRVEHNRQVYTLNYSGPKALLVIERLRGRLVRKSAEAEVALSFIEKGQVGRRFGPRGVPPQLEAIRITHYNKLRALK